MRNSLATVGLILLLAEVVGGQSLRVVSPNGGENWTVGQKRAITWQAQGVSTPVTIILRRDGVRVGTIAANLPAAQGSYSWTVGVLLEGNAAPAGTGYAVRIRSEDNLAGDTSDQNFRISQFIQAGSSPGSLPSKPGNWQPLPGQQHTIPDITILPDLELTAFHFDRFTETFRLEMTNRSETPYVGYVRIKMTKEEGGCPSREQRTYFPNLQKDMRFLLDLFPCTVFGTPCRQRIHVELLPEIPEANTANNVFDAMVPFHRTVNHRLGDSPIRLRFSHGSKTLPRDFYAYGPENTISRNDILNDYDPQRRRASFIVDVPVVNCGAQGGNGFIRYRVTWRQGDADEVLASAPLWDAPVGLEPGESRLVSRSLDLPVRRGEYFITFISPNLPEYMGTVAFRFSEEFF